MNYPDPVVYHFPRWLLPAVVASLILGFPLSLLMILDSESVTDAVGGLTVLVIIILTAIFLRNRWSYFSKSAVVLTLIPQGLKLGLGGIIPWRDVSEIKTTRIGSYTTKMIGVRLSSYAAYISSLSPEEVERLRGGARASRIGGFAIIPATLIDPASYVEAALTLKPSNLLQWDLLSTPQRDVARMLLHSRTRYGWEVMFGAAAFAPNTKSALMEMRRYQEAALSDSSLRVNRVLGACANCKLCTGNAFTGMGKNAGRRTADLAALDITASARKTCNECEHPMSEHHVAQVEVMQQPAQEVLVYQAPMTRQGPPPRPPGWFHDPTDNRALCWWDGAQWHPQTKHYPAQPPS